MLNPRATNSDLTAKARIRNAAMDLYAQHGEERVSLRAVAAEAGVTLGLVQHHFKTKAGLRDAVDQLIIEYFAQALASAERSDDPRQNAANRDIAVQRMLEQTPAVINYLRRAALDPANTPTHLATVFTEFTRNEIHALREAGLASTKRSEAVQVLALMVRMIGELMLQPLVDGVWERVGDSHDGDKPRLVIEVRD